jgi:hypothetical protein
MADGDGKKIEIPQSLQKPMCVCGHNTTYHPTIAGSQFRRACGKVLCPCKCWRPVDGKNKNIHKGKK